MSLADTFAALCAKHDLSSISVALMLVGDEQRVLYSSYAHWHGHMSCASGDGETPELAISNAIAEANKKRSVAVDVPALEMGELAA